MNFNLIKVLSKTFKIGEYMNALSYPSGKTVYFDNSQDQKNPISVIYTDEKWKVTDITKDGLPDRKMSMPVIVNFDYVTLKDKVCSSVTPIRNLTEKPTESKIQELINKGRIGVLNIENNRVNSLELANFGKIVMDDLGIERIVICYPAEQSYGWLESKVPRLALTKEQYESKTKSLVGFLKKTGLVA